MVYQQKFVTPEFVVRFPDLEQPGKISRKYGVKAIFMPGTDVSILKQKIKAAIEDKWGGNKPESLLIPLREAEDETHAEYYPPGAHVCNLRTSRQPILVDRNEAIRASADKFHPGCTARAVVHCYAYDKVGDNQPGVFLALDMLQFISEADMQDASHLLAEQPLEAAQEESAGGDDGAQPAPGDDDWF